MKFVGIAITAVVCLTAGFFGGRTLQERQTIAKIEIVNDSGQPLSGYEIVTLGAGLEAGQRRELFYGMRGESGYRFKATFADGSTAESREIYVSSGERQTVTLGANKEVSVGPGSE